MSFQRAAYTSFVLSATSDRAAILVELDLLLQSTRLVAVRDLLHALHLDLEAEAAHEAELLSEIDPTPTPWGFKWEVLGGFWGDGPVDSSELDA